MQYSVGGIYPTLMGAMTGYVANNDTLVRLKDGQYLNYADFKASDRVFICLSYDGVAADGINYHKDSPNATLWRELNRISPVEDDERYVSYQEGQNLSQPCEDFEILHYIGNSSYDNDWVLSPNNVQCIANNTYQWGFSSIFIYVPSPAMHSGLLVPIVSGRMRIGRASFARRDAGWENIGRRWTWRRPLRRS
jgi:hypothetical protein